MAGRGSDDGFVGHMTGIVRNGFMAVGLKEAVGWDHPYGDRCCRGFLRASEPPDGGRSGAQITLKGGAQVKRGLMGPAVALLVCLAAGALYAGYDQAMGQIKSIDVDGGRLVLSVRTGRDTPATDTTFLVDKDTTVKIGREKKTLKDLAEGNRCTVVYKEADKADGNATALLISVMGERRRPGGGGGDAN